MVTQIYDAKGGVSKYNIRYNRFSYHEIKNILA